MQLDYILTAAVIRLCRDLQGRIVNLLRSRQKL